MTTPATPTDTKPAPSAPNHEETLRQAWERYGSFIYITCGVVALGILAKGGWDYLNAQKEVGIQAEYAQCVTMDSFRSFASNHPGHPLAGAAEVVVADNAYATGKFGDAVSVYTAAAADLPPGPVQQRAKLGLAMSLVLSGRSSEAEASLRQLLNDTTLLKQIRCEAGYHLASVAAAAGRNADVQKFAEQVMQIDATSPFAERAFALRSSVNELVGVPGAVAVPAKP
jgi:hypothetical protein